MSENDNDNPSPFRPFNNNERTVIEKSITRFKIKNTHPLWLNTSAARVSYEKMQGGFCICTIVVYFYLDPLDADNVKRILFRGASRRSYKDPRNNIKGELLAFSRAVLYSRPVDVQ